jgi:DnaK suppressor protein
MIAAEEGRRRKMDHSELDTTAIRAKLEARRAELENASKDAADARAPVELDQTSVGRLSRMDALQGQAMALATERCRLDSILRINQALARLKAGTYGECALCGEEIEPKRLALDPALLTCLACASGKTR